MPSQENAPKLIQNIAASSQRPLLEISDLKKWFPIRRGIFFSSAGHIRALDGISLVINQQETLGLVGESGCGKTTLGRVIMGLERASAGALFFHGKNLLTLNSRQRQALRARMQMVFQDPYASLNPRLTAMHAITEGLAAQGLLHGSRAAVASELLAKVGLPPDALYRYPFEFSGGQRQRISLARALALRPELLVCDEPVSALDVSVQAQTLNLMMELKERYQLSYLFISHDLGVVKHICDRVAVMYLGHIMEEGRTTEIMEQPRHPYTQALIDAVRVPGRPRRQKIILTGEVPSASNPPRGCPFHTRCPRVMNICRHHYPPEQRKASRRIFCHLYVAGGL